VQQEQVVEVQEQTHRLIAREIWWKDGEREERSER
jgi:hypothetical protein